LNGLAQSFIKMACENQLAVVFMNQMTTRVKTSQLGQSHLIPALGESWGHASTIQIVLYWGGNQRKAKFVTALQATQNATAVETKTAHGLK